MESLLQEPEFWVAVAFGIFMLFALWKITGPILAALDGRAARIKDELEEAQRLREEAQHLLAEHKRKQRDVAGEAAEMLANAREQAKRLGEAAERDLEAALERREQQAIDRIAHAEVEALGEVRALAVDLAVSATRKLLADKLDAKTAAKLVDRSIKDLSDKLH